MQSEWIKDLNFNPGTLKLLGTLKDTLQDTEAGKGF